MATLADGLLAGFQGAQALGQQRFQNRMAEEQLALNKQRMSLLEQSQAIQNENAEVLRTTRANTEFMDSTPSRIFNDEGFNSATGDISPALVGDILNSGTQQEKDWLNRALGYKAQTKNAEGEPLEFTGVLSLPPSLQNREGGYAVGTRNTVTGEDGVITESGTKDPNDRVQVFNADQLARRASGNLAKILGDGGFDSSVYRNRARITQYDIRAAQQAQNDAALTSVASSLIVDNPALTPVEARQLEFDLDSASEEELRSFIFDFGGQEALDAAEADIAKRQDQLQAEQVAVPEGYAAVDVANLPAGNKNISDIGTSWNTSISNLSNARDKFNESKQKLRSLEDNGASSVEIEAARRVFNRDRAAVDRTQGVVDETLASLGSRIEAAEAYIENPNTARGGRNNANKNRRLRADARNIEDLKGVYTQMDPSAVMANTQLESGATSPPVNITKEVLFGEATKLNEAIEKANLSPDFIEKQRQYYQQMGIQTSQDLVDKLPPKEFMIAAFTIAAAEDNPANQQSILQNFRNLYNRGASDYSFGEQIDDKINIAQIAQRDRDYLLDLNKFQRDNLNDADANVRYAAQQTDALITALTNKELDLDSSEIKAEFNKYVGEVINPQNAGSGQNQALKSYEPRIVGEMLRRYVQENNNESFEEFFANILRESPDSELNMANIYDSMVVNEEGNKIGFVMEPGTDWRGQELFEGEIDFVELSNLFGRRYANYLMEGLKDNERVVNF